MRAATVLVWAIAVAALTLTPQPVSHAGVRLSRLCVVCGDRGVADAVLNVVLFVPLGLAMARRGLGSVVLIGFLVSGSIEAAQLFLPGRYPTLGDVVWNTAGTAVGRWSFAGRTWLTEPPRSVATGAVVALVLGLFGAGLLLDPNWTRDRYWGQWTADLGYMPQYRGRLLSATLDTLSVPPGRFPEDARPRRLLQGDFTVRIVVVKGPPPPEVSPILSIYDGHEREIVLLGAVGEDVVWRERTRARLARLDQPDLRLANALAAAQVGDTLVIEALRRGRERCLRAEGQRACGLGFSPARTWSLFLWPDGAGRRTRAALDLLWLIALFAPVGFLSRGGWAALRNAAVSVGGLLGAVVGTRLVAPAPREWIAIAAALALGGGVGVLVRRLRRGAGLRPRAGPTRPRA